MDILKRATKYLMPRVEGQRQLTAAEEGSLQVHLSAFGTLGVVHEVVDELRSMALGSDPLAAIEPAAADVSIINDRALVKRVLDGLIRNAIQVSGPGEVVTAGCRHRGNSVEFLVHHGAVMSQDLEAGNCPRTKRRTGDLGIQSVKLLTERYLHGSIQFDSAEPHGTTFLLTCPLAHLPSGRYPRSAEQDRCNKYAPA